VFLPEEEKAQILEILDIKEAEDCKSVREQIKIEARKIHQHTPIKHWVEGERPRGTSY